MISNGVIDTSKAGFREGKRGTLCTDGKGGHSGDRFPKDTDLGCIKLVVKESTSSPKGDAEGTYT